MRVPAHAAVLVVYERDVNVGAPNFGVFGIKVFGRVWVALRVVMSTRLIKQEGVDAVVVPAFRVMVRSDAVAVFVPGVSLAVASIPALGAVLCVVLAPLAILNVASEVQRVAQCDAEVFVSGAGLQFEVRNAWVGGEMESGHLAACRVVLFEHFLADAGSNTSFTWRAAFRCD